MLLHVYRPGSIHIHVPYKFYACVTFLQAQYCVELQAHNSLDMNKSVWVSNQGPSLDPPSLPHKGGQFEDTSSWSSMMHSEQK